MTFGTETEERATMPKKVNRKKARVIYVVQDCKWGTVRGAYWTRNEAVDARSCVRCKIIKFVECLTS